MLIYQDMKTTMKTVNVRFQGQSAKAYATETGKVRVWDDVAGHYTVCHDLTPAQVRYVVARTAVRS